MKRHPFVGGLLTATLATGLLLVGSAPASAQKAESASAQLVADGTDLRGRGNSVRPPVLVRPRVRCHDSGAVVVVKLRNPSRVILFFEVRLSGGSVAEALPVMLAARGVETVEFHGIPNGRYRVDVMNDRGDFVTDTRVRVRCNAVPARPSAAVRAGAR
ncbi:hypothetical protein [Kribbella shirazensis]|uniref:Uncharacterized protein n=1 Tax=Kribbella shirazensis TaxID=1105143 RepID=A0A7X5V490_9ACTN|nr:hypothetical protein [Kribbella shirazensis]NIK54328.1 hypothetical protein [Kribbella shirazensis]